jgi:hypothetical protein
MWVRRSEIILSLNLLLNVFDQPSAREFTAGIGWDTIKTAVENRFSPDELILIEKLLITCCHWDHNMLTQNGLYFKSALILFRAFTRNSRKQYTDKGQQNIQDNYMNQALRRLKRESTLTDRIKRIDTLNEWNTFIFNLMDVEPGFIRERISPLLRKFPARMYNRWFGKSDLKTIGYFLSYFNPGEPLFTWKLPGEIRFDFKDFSQQVENSTLGDIAHFIFNFYYINRPDLCHRFAEEINANFLETLLSKMKEKETLLRDIDFLLWNTWTTLSENKAPCLLHSPGLVEILLEKAKQHTEKNEDLLAIIGTYFLAAGRAPEAVTRAINVSTIPGIEELIKDRAYKGMRITAGYHCLTGEKMKAETFKTYFGFIHDNVRFTDIPNQKIMLDTFTRQILE